MSTSVPSPDVGLEEFEAMWGRKAKDYVLLRGGSGELTPYNPRKQSGYMLPKEFHDEVVRRMLEAGVQVVEPDPSP